MLTQWTVAAMMQPSSPLLPLRDRLEVVLEGLGLAVGMVAALIVLWGVGRNVWSWAQLELRTTTGPRFSSEERERAREELRRALGYYLLLGLEFLVAADVLETMLTPTTSRVLTLASVVLLRTILAFSLNWELRHESTPGATIAHPVLAETASVGDRHDVATTRS